MKIEKQIKDNILKFISNPAFFSRIIAEKPKEDDLIVLNNSFFHRQEETNKNSKYIAFTLTSRNKLKELFVIEGFRINSDFKIVSSKATNYTKTNLLPALKKELGALGKLVFILIAEINDQIKITERFNAPLFEEINFDTSLSTVSIKGTTLNIFDTNDEELIWNAVADHFVNNPDFSKHENAMRIELLNAIERIDSNSIATFTLPSKIKVGNSTAIDSLIKFIEKQILDYENSFDKTTGIMKHDKNSYNEVLRISYNFASDATTFIKLISNICDLKPVVLWGTIYEHFILSTLFKSLPYNRVKSKASLKNYFDTIGSARNTAFHKLFPFKRTIEGTLPNESLKDVKLRLFSNRRNRNENQLNYQDKELVEILTEFTRTDDHKVTPAFWKKNLDVMRQTLEVFKVTSRTLKILIKDV
jgi:hypothetical protein